MFFFHATPNNTLPTKGVLAQTKVENTKDKIRTGSDFDSWDGYELSSDDTGNAPNVGDLGFGRDNFSTGDSLKDLPNKKTTALLSDMFMLCISVYEREQISKIDYFYIFCFRVM